MNLMAMLRRTGGIDALARQTDSSTASVRAEADTLFPELVEEFLNFPGGMSGVLVAIEKCGGAGMAAEIMANESTDPEPGVRLLKAVGHGGGVRSGQQPGRPSPTLRERLLPLLAMLLGGYLAARAKSEGLNEQDLANLLAARRSDGSDNDEAV